MSWYNGGMRVGVVVLPLVMVWLAGCGGASAGAADGSVSLPLKHSKVFFFVLHDCPICNAYAPEMARVVRDYAGEGVAASVVYVDEGVSEESLRQHALEYAYPCPTVIDAQRQMARQYGVRVVPQAVVAGSDGQVQYSGRIDDLYAELGKKRIAPTARDLRDALDAVVEGRPVAKPHVPPIGCTIEY